MPRLDARWIFPIESEPFGPGFVEWEDGIITEIGRTHAGDASQTSILPALVNCHTHLEFSHLREPIPPGECFPDWIRSVISDRETREANPSDARGMGIRECRAGGASAIAEIATTAWEPDDSDLPITVFRELLALSPDRVSEQMSLARDHVAHLRAVRNITPAIGPHAPYSVHPELFDAAIEFAIAEQLPVAMHLAETTEEIELLTHGSGPFRAFLEEIGLWHSGLFPQMHCSDYLRRLAEVPRGLVIHGTHLEDEELELLAEYPTLSLIYCPRTTHHFGMGEHPAGRAAAMGANVALGTDSRASNPDLSMRNELHWLMEQQTIAPAEALRMATVNGRRALGLPGGTLVPGAPADLLEIPIARESSEPYAALISGLRNAPA